MVEKRKRVQRGSNGRYRGCRVNCEQVPMLPASVVRRIWDDPRDIPYLFTWTSRPNGARKEVVRIYRNPIGSDPSGGDSVEIVPIHASNVQIRIAWQRQPHGG